MMLTVISSLWTRINGYLALAFVAVTSIAVAYASGIRRGREATERRTLEGDVANATTRAEVDRDVARTADPSEQLREQWSRK
jgi:hypothetical protein